MLRSMLRRFHEAVQASAPEVTIWGTGVDCTIRELAQTIARVSGFKGKLTFDASKPDGMPRKLLDVSRLTALGWRASIALEDGLRDAYAWYVANQDGARLV